MSDNGFFEMNTENNGEFQEYKPSISFDFTSMKKGYFCPLSQIIKCFVDWEGRDEEYRHGLVEALSTKKELTANDIQELYSRLYID